MRNKKEEQLQKVIFQYINLFKKSKGIYYPHSIPNGMYLGQGRNKGAYMNEMKKQGLLTGATDIELGYRFLIYHIELKVDKGKLSESQVAVQKEIEHMQQIGYQVRHVVVRDTLDDFIEKVINDQS